MPGADKGDDVGAHVVEAHALSRFRIVRAQQQRQQVGGSGRARFDQLFSRRDDVVDSRGEKRERRPAPQLPKPRQEFRRAQQIQRIDTADRVEITRHGALKLARISPEAAAEQGLFEHLQRRQRHLLADLDQADVASSAQARRRASGDAVHRRSKVRHDPRGEQRRYRAPLRAPGVAVDGE
jgi:hypothetical protein